MCEDCKSPMPSMFIVKNQLWASFGTGHMLLCIACFEKRMGRKVTLHDLSPCFISEGMLLGAYVAKNTPDMPPDDVLLNPKAYMVGTLPDEEYKFSK